jgi:hypothetical protein
MTTPMLDPDAQQALAERCREVAADPTRIRIRFAAAAREIARDGGTAAELAEPGAARVEDRVRVELLRTLGEALADDPDRLAAEVADLYRFGDADERRAILLGLPVLEHAPIRDRMLDLVHDALRTNDPRLVAAALGPYAAEGLDPAAWRQGILKCLFVGVPLRHVAGLGSRTDAELLRMVSDYADERRAAGRPVPTDAVDLLSGRASSDHPHEKARET